MQLTMHYTGRCTPPQVEASHGQEQYYVTFSRMHLRILTHLYIYIVHRHHTLQQEILHILVLPTKHIYHARPREQTTPQKHISWFNNRQVTQITYAALYKHLALLFTDSSWLCIYMTSPHILAPNVWKCYQDYFQSTPIHSYPSMSSLLYYCTKVLLSRNYFHWLFIEKEQNYVRSP